ncbi:MAG: response regulator [candidate division NC10 bacterium]|nr:response regulator [candidate division NC10 bacterium]
MTPRILIADDSATIQKVVELTFSKEDFQIIKAMSGVEAIAKAKESRPDIILVDLFMPDRSGYEVCESLRSDPQLREVPIILLVGAFETFDRERSVRSGANDYVTKPFESRQLIAKVKQHLFARTAKMAPQGVGREGEAPQVKVVAPPSEEKPPSRPPVEVPLTPPAMAPAEVAPAPEVAPRAEPEREKEPMWSMEAEILTPSSAPVGGEGVPLKEEEVAVSDEELWQMLDLSGSPSAPLTPPAKEGEEELTLVPEDSAERFFELYSQDTHLEVTPEPTAAVKEEELFAAPSSAEGAATEEGTEKAGAEMISFENLTEAVMEAEILVPPQEEKPPLVREEVSAVKEEIDSRLSPEVAPEGAVSEQMMASIADRIVKEVTDRLVSRMEKIIWEVVPDLAEALITKEIEKIKAAAEEQETS